MTGFMATTAGGENPVGSTSYNKLFAVGLPLFVITLVINMISISPRPPLQAGLLMSIAASTAREGPCASRPVGRDQHPGLVDVPGGAVVLAVLRRHGAASS